MILTNWKKDYIPDPNDTIDLDLFLLQDGSFALQQDSSYIILQASAIQFINTLWTNFVDSITNWGKDSDPTTTWTPDQT